MKKLLAVAALALVLTSVVQAQGTPVSGTVSATATVQTPLTVAGSRNLAFGNVFPGLNATILPTTALSGRFTIGGQANAQVTLAFVTPTNLTSGANNLAMDFTTGNQAAFATADFPGSATTFSTVTGTTTRLELLNGTLFVYIGGIVQPTASQVAGPYTGTITLNVAYTGL